MLRAAGAGSGQGSRGSPACVPAAPGHGRPERAAPVRAGAQPLPQRPPGPLFAVGRKRGCCREAAWSRGTCPLRSAPQRGPAGCGPGEPPAAPAEAPCFLPLPAVIGSSFYRRSQEAACEQRWPGSSAGERCAASGQPHRERAGSAAGVVSSYVPPSAGLCAQTMPTSRGMSTGEPS